MDYIAYLHKDRRSDFSVSFPDFPGCVTAGKTLDEARRAAAEVLALHIDGMSEDGEALPKPSTIEDVADDPDSKRAVAFLVSVDHQAEEPSGSISRRDESQARPLTRLAYLVHSALGHPRHRKGRRVQ